MQASYVHRQAGARKASTGEKHRHVQNVMIPHLCKHDNVPEEAVEIILVENANAKEGDQGHHGHNTLVADDVSPHGGAAPQHNGQDADGYHSHLHRRHSHENIAFDVKYYAKANPSDTSAS